MNEEDKKRARHGTAGCLECLATANDSWKVLDHKEQAALPADSKHNREPMKHEMEN
jgi:hypothetical protein